MTIVPGRGIKQLHLGQTALHLRSTFGSPQRRTRSGAFREYWVYPQAGFECIVSRRTGRILSIFLSAQNIFEWNEFFGASEDRIRSLFSTPQLEGGGFTAGKKFFGRWYSYPSGIGFHFDASGRVETVSIFARKRSAMANTAAGHGRPHAHSVAALRRA